MKIVNQFALLTAVILGTVANSAVAQSALTGFYGQISTGYEHNSVDSFGMVGTDNGGTPSDSANPSFNSDSLPLVIGLGYTFQMPSRFTLGLGVEYSALPQDTNIVGISDSNEVGAPVFDYHLTISNRLNVFLAPGYAIDDTKLAYLKLGYSNQQIQYAQNNCCSTPSNKARVDGYVIGLGYKQMISAGSFNGLYGFVEANYQAYSQANMHATYTDGVGGKTTATPTSNAYNLLVGVGYKF